MPDVTLSIDGRCIVVEKGTTVLQAALASGIEIPFFCYHPALSIEGSCRACLVRVERLPKLQTACSTVCTDGMVVHTTDPEAVEARAMVIEFLLLNHPLDCPVCDKGGECPLQDYSDRFGSHLGRKDTPKRTFDGEGAACDIDFGPMVMLNRNRCILCSRCVRFMVEIHGEAQIRFIDRSYDSCIATFREQGVHSLLSGNLADICPVGALTTKDYRYRARPWDNLAAFDTVCTLCAKGCSVNAWIRGMAEWVRGPRLIRLTPRLNPAVNGYFMCDIGRFGYHWIESHDRLTHPQVRDAAGVLHDVAWEDAMAAVASRLAGSTRNLACLASAHGSNEELYLLRELGRALELQSGAVVVAWRESIKAQPAQTTFRIPAIDAPNVMGAAALGLVPAPTTGPTAQVDSPRNGEVALEALRSSIAAGRITALYLFDPGPAESAGDLAWVGEARRRGPLSTLVVQATMLSPAVDAADIVLPGSCWLEKDGTFTNQQGYVQHVVRVIPPRGEAREDWRILTDVARAMGAAASNWDDLTGIRHAMADALGPLPARESRALQTWLDTSNPLERWKWERMYRDLPPVKFEGSPDRRSWPTPEERMVPPEEE